MPSVKIDQRRYSIQENESVLDCLLRNNVDLVHSCRAGICQSCLVKVSSGPVNDKAQEGLKSTLQAGGYALACQWQPDSDVEMSMPGLGDSAQKVFIKDLTPLSQDVMRLTVQITAATSEFSARPGQYLSLINPAGISRSYSIANDVEKDGVLEFHIARIENGEFTSWLFDQAQPGQSLHIRGPAGNCFYVAEGEQDYPLVLAGTGTGLAPLYGIVNDALAQGHHGQISLLQGGRTPQRLYYVEKLSALAEQYENFHYQALVLENDPAPAAHASIQQGDITAGVLAALNPDAMKSTRVYLCGAPLFVNALRKQVFLKGVSSSNIFCDAFLTRSDKQ